MATPVLMPQQGNTVEECLLVAWKKKTGDKIEKGEVIADIETDKASFELESPASGTLLVTFAKEGELVPVLSTIAAIGNPGEPVDGLKPDKALPKETVKTISENTRTNENTKGETAPAQVSQAQVPGKQVLSPRARAFLKRHPINHSLVNGTGPGGRITEKDLKIIWNSKPRASALAGNLISQGAMAPSSGSGINNMIMSNDLSEPGKPMTGIRAIIAERMVDSLLSTAQYTVSADAPAEKLLSLREKIKSIKGKSSIPDITIGDMVMFACIKTLAEFPDMNSELIDNKIFRHKDINLGFACDTSRGLMVPIIKKCQSMTLSELCIKSKELAQKAIEGKINPDDLTGGTFTISNLGGMGVTSFTPVLNAPQVAILGVCSISLKPSRKDGTIIHSDVISFSITADHQAVDGAMAARFLQALGKTISKIDELSGLKL